MPKVFINRKKFQTADALPVKAVFVGSHGHVFLRCRDLCVRLDDASEHYNPGLIEVDRVLINPTITIEEG